MASNVGQGPPAGENNEPSTLRGAVPGQGGQEGGFRSNLDDMRESINVVGKLSSAMSQFSSKIGGDGKRKITEFSASIRSMNEDLEETIRLLKEANEEGLSGERGGGLWTPATTTSGGVSYTKSQLPSRPGDVERDVTRATDLGDIGADRPGRERTGDQGGGGLRRWGQAAAIGGIVGSPFAMSSWFERQRDPTMAANLQFNRIGMATGQDPARLNQQMQQQFDQNRYRGHEEFFTTQQTLEQRGLAMGGASFEQAMESAGAMRQFMPHQTTEAIAGASAELQHGMVGRELQMRGITRHGESVDESFRRILKHLSPDGKMPSREQLLIANPGTDIYEALLRMMNGDVQMVRMVLDWGIAEAHSVAETGQGIQLTEAHAERMGLTDTTEHAERSSEAAASGNVAMRYEQLSKALRTQHTRAEFVTDQFRKLGDNLPGLNESVVALTGASNSAVGAMGGTISSLGSLVSQFVMFRLALGRGLGLGAAVKGVKGAAVWGAGKLGLGTAAAATGGGATTAAAGTTTAGTAAATTGGAAAVGTAATAAGVLTAVGGASYLTARGMLSADEWAVEQGIFEEDRYGEESGGDATDWDELDAMAKQARDPQRYARELGQTEPGGGPPFGWVYGSDHDGPGYSTKGFGGVRPHVARAGHYLNKAFGPFPGGIGGVGQRSGKSDHPRGLALDFMTMKNTKLGDRVVNYLSRNAKHFAVKYIIWKQRINSGDGRGWRKMEDRGSITANHFDHPHVSFEDAPSYGSGGFEPFTDDTDDTGAFDIGEEETTGTGFSSDASTSTSGFFSSEEADILSGMFGGSSGGEGGSRTQPGTETSGEGYTDQDAGGARPSVSGTGTLSDTEIARLAQYGGWRGSDIITATAVALAESRGNPRGIGDTHINPGTGEQSTGLWQIHYRPSRDRNNPIRNPQANLDPHQNAKNAFRIFQDQGWGAWSVHPASRGYTPSNSYTNYLDRARSAVGSLGSNVEPAGGLEMAGHLSEGQPSGGSMSVGASMPSLSASQTRQVNVRMDIKIERASREEAERLAEIVKDIVQQEEGVKMVATR